MTYTDVTWLELFGGWLLSGIFMGLLILAIAKSLSLSRRIKQMEWVKASQWSATDYANIIKGQRVKIAALQAQIARYTVRNRGKDGRFKKKEKV